MDKKIFNKLRKKFLKEAVIFFNIPISKIGKVKKTKIKKDEEF